MIRIILLLLFAALGASAQGVTVQPDEEGAFSYGDDFTTPRFLREALLDGVDESMWVAGDIRLIGPNRHRNIIYRFHGEHVIENAVVSIDQMANRRYLGGRNMFYISSNGLDWRLVDDSLEQPADSNKWQKQPLRYEGESPGLTELWVRIEMDNNTGLKTNPSNFIKRIDVTLTLGQKAVAGADPQAEARTAWASAVEAGNWRPIVSDASSHPPRYGEAVDGAIIPDERMIAQRAYVRSESRPVALVCFVRTQASDQPIVARLTLRAARDASRKVYVKWNGRAVAHFDIGQFFEDDRLLHVVLTGPHRAGVNELRIGGDDSQVVTIRRLELVGAAQPRWVDKPAPLPGGRIQVVSAVYQPDPAPPPDSQAVEGRHKKQDAGLIFTHLQKIYADCGDFGALRVVLRNTGSKPVHLVGDLLLNGKSLADHYVDFETAAWDARGVVWSRIRPRIVAPGGCAQVYVRFRRRPAGDSFKLTIPREGGQPIGVDIPAVGPAVTIDYVVAHENKLYVYARSKEARVRQVTLDGRPVNADLYGPDFPGGIALGVVALDSRLQQGTYHVAGVQLDDGRHIAAQFRVLRFFFPRTSIHATPELCAELNMNMTMWFMSSLEKCNASNVDTAARTRNLFNTHERVAYIYGPDEPDAHDNQGGGYDRGLGYNARMLERSQWQSLVERYAPQTASWLIINGTTRPLHWAVYGQLADIISTDPYPIHGYGADHTVVRESLNQARLCGAPRPLIACLEAYGFDTEGERPPTPAEWRQNVTQSVGCGAKGLTSWVCLNYARGFRDDARFKEQVAAVNKMLGHIETELLLATPIGLATNDSADVMTGVVGDIRWPKQRVWTSALLAGPDAIIVAATNHIPPSKPDPPAIEPAKDVTVTVQLPPWVTGVEAYEATEDGLVTHDIVVQPSRALLQLDRIESGRIFLLKVIRRQI